MQAKKKGKSWKAPPAGDNRRKNADPERKAEAVKPVEGAQTGSQGLGYLEKPADDAKNNGRRK